MKNIRINKFVADNSKYSRREIDKLIVCGSVFVNNKKALLGQKIDGSESIRVKSEKINIKKEKILIAYNKPVGVICTTDKNNKDNIISKINFNEKIYPIGRLDVVTSGLILLTNSSVLKRKFENPNSFIEKEYLVILNRSINQRFINNMRSGVNIGGYTTKPAIVVRISSRKLSLTITEGKNRQIRKMVQKLGYEVVKLIRIRIANIQLDDLKQNSYRIIKKYKANSLDIQGRQMI